MVVNIIISILFLYLFSVVFVLIDDVMFYIIDFIEQRFKKEEFPTKKYKDVKEMFNRTRKPNLLREIYYTIYRFFDEIKKSPFTLYRNTKWFIQRGIRGYSDKDCWCADGYLSSLIPKMLKQLKINQHILPGWDTENESEEVAQERWHGYLDNMIYTFEIAEKILWDRYYYQKSKNYSIKKANEYNEIFNTKKYKARALTEKECIKYENGWVLFQEHYFSLWD